MQACMCASEMCKLFGCQDEAAKRRQFAPFAIPIAPIPPTNPGAMLPGKTYVAPELTEADVRRIVREELAKQRGSEERGHG